MNIKHKRAEKSQLVKPEEALSGRFEAIPTSEIHEVLSTPIKPPFPEHLQCITFAMGCFWGVERLFWSLPGVYTTAAGYIAGYTPHPLYDEVCSGMTGHTEAVLVVYDPKVVTLEGLLKVFWESHDPTQGMRQGNDIGSQYRSGIYYYHQDLQLDTIIAARDAYQQALNTLRLRPITTDIELAENFYYAEAYHQQYLAKNPKGYCGLKGCGVVLPEV